MKRPLVRLATRIFGVPLMIHQRKLDVIINALESRLKMDSDWSEDNDDSIEEISSEANILPVNGKVAVIQVHGPLVHRASWLDAMCGITGYTDIGQAFAEALDSPDIDAILLDVDSPGGECAGCFELVDQIYAGRGKKPIIGVANEMAFSAGYALISACEKVYVTQTSHVGSIGVVATHLDQSEADKKAGLKYTHIIAGEKKIDFNPHQPLSDRAEKTIQEEVNAMYQIFVGSVSRNRGLSSLDVAGTEAGLFMGKDAVASGLADEIIQISELSEKLQETIMAKKTITTLGAPAASASGPDPKEKTPGQTPTPAGDEGEGDDGGGEGEGDDTDGEDLPPPPPDRTPAPAPASSSDPVAQARKDAAKISNICAVAGKPELAADFISRGLTVDQAKAQLFDKLAAGEIDIKNAHNPVRPEGSDQGTTLLVGAMKDLNARDKKPKAA